MIDKEYKMHMKVLKKSRKDPKPGDIFTFQVRDGEYMFGRVIKDNVSGGGFKGAVLIYIYNVISNSKDIIPHLKKKDLLLPPRTVTPYLWRDGYFETISNSKLTDDDVFKTHCFIKRHPLDRKKIRYFMNEYGEKLVGGIKPCGEGGVVLIQGMNKEIMKALGKESSSKSK